MVRKPPLHDKAITQPNFISDGAFYQQIKSGVLFANK
jgi:hypothetical protein